jgi:UPF0755 protein
MSNKLIKRFFILLLSTGLCALGGVFFAVQWMQTPVPLSAKTTQATQTTQVTEVSSAPAPIFDINRGESTAQIANRLAAAGHLQWPLIWRAYAHWVENKPIQAGEYQLPARVTPLGILHQLQRGEVIKYTVTFPEGITYNEFLEILKQQPKLRHELSNKPIEEHKKLLQFSYETLDGWFFPDTYSYLAGDSDKTILVQAHKKMQQTIERAWRSRAENLPYMSAGEALVMASIIEKETGDAREREKIAGVFVRRLKAKMRLQTDPSVIYGLGEAYSGNLTQKDLQTPGPYNTYLNEGLPPGPIANPGEKAIYAALHPAEGDELYFVAKGDGSHVFSAHLNEHNKAVEHYQRTNRTEHYRSSPQNKNTP